MNYVRMLRQNRSTAHRVAQQCGPFVIVCEKSGKVENIDDEDGDADDRAAVQFILA